MRRSRPAPLLAAIALARPAAAPRVLRVSAIPDEAPTELIRKFRPLGEYLEKALSMEVKFLPVTDYPATVEGLAGGNLDLVWYGGFTFVQAQRRTGNAVPLLQREEDARFHSKFITSVASPIRSLADVKGKTLAFGSVSSTSGHLMPRYYLLQAGIDPDRDLASYSFSGAHDLTAKWVESGKVEAGRSTSRCGRSSSRRGRWTRRRWWSSTPRPPSTTTTGPRGWCRRSRPPFWPATMGSRSIGPSSTCSGRGSSSRPARRTATPGAGGAAAATHPRPGRGASRG
jgi:phosphate/phosphite/phosphonate ABC transporter binding protein